MFFELFPQAGVGVFPAIVDWEHHMKYPEIFPAMVECIKKIELIFLSQVIFIFSFVVGGLGLW